MTITISTISKTKKAVYWLATGFYRDCLLRDRRCRYSGRADDDGQPGAPRIPGIPRNHSRRLEAARRRGDHAPGLPRLGVIGSA
jgi:hypothetical protein